jgi:hypothetical protein
MEMTTDRKFRQGTPEWFHMVGRLMCDFALQAGLPAAFNVSLVERYSDGCELSDGLVQGIRFDILNGKPSFRASVGREERGDVVIEISSAAARDLNLLRSADPKFAITLDAALGAGDMRINGDISRFGSWLDAVHDSIVDHTE